MAKRATLTDFASRKTGGEAEVKAPEPAVKPATDERKGQTLRLTPEAWRQLKTLALDRGTTSHALLIEWVNDGFQKAGKPPLA